jgi:hypothetical protein
MYKYKKKEVAPLDQHEGEQIGEQVQEYDRRRRVYGERFYHADNTGMYAPN